MAVTPKFGSRELIHCLVQLGFKPLRQYGTRHQKFIPPTKVKVSAGQRSFIMVQLNIKTYDSNACSRYISQIKSLGFSRDQIIYALTHS